MSWPLFEYKTMLICVFAHFMISTRKPRIRDIERKIVGNEYSDSEYQIKIDIVDTLSSVYTGVLGR